MFKTWHSLKGSTITSQESILLFVNILSMYDAVFFFLFSSTGFIKFQSNIVVWRNWRRILKNWTQIPNKFSEMLKTVRLTCEKPYFLENIQIWHLSSGALCIHQKIRKIQGMMLDFFGQVKYLLSENKHIYIIILNSHKTT